VPDDRQVGRPMTRSQPRLIIPEHRQPTGGDPSWWRMAISAGIAVAF
jgi:hypothetical protein